MFKNVATKLWPFSNFIQNRPTCRNMLLQGGQMCPTHCSQQRCKILRWNFACVWPGLKEASRTLCLFSVELRLELQFFGVVQMDVRCFSLQCFGWAWYLANDTQFYIIAPAILFVAYRYELKRECICYQKKSSNKYWSWHLLPVSYKTCVWGIILLCLGGYHFPPHPRPRKLYLSLPPPVVNVFSEV